MTPELSLVIPIRNESPNIRPLYDELMQVLGATGRRFEVIVIDDGSTDDSFAQLAARCRGIKFVGRQHAERQLGRTKTLLQDALGIAHQQFRHAAIPYRNGAAVGIDLNQRCG